MTFMYVYLTHHKCWIYKKYLEFTGKKIKKYILKKTPELNNRIYKHTLHKRYYSQLIRSNATHHNIGLEQCLQIFASNKISALKTRQNTEKKNHWHWNTWIATEKYNKDLKLFDYILMFWIWAHISIFWFSSSCLSFFIRQFFDALRFSFQCHCFSVSFFFSVTVLCVEKERAIYI